MSDINTILKRDYISLETCDRLAEVCRLRYGRLMDVQEQLLFQTLEKLCLQAGRYASEKGLAELQRESESLGMYGP
jgi:hypothetical protein